ncbi:MAG: aminoglycoside phosphotransferase family protein [Anaerolineae bacterium]
MDALLAHYLTLWALTQPQPLAETRTSRLYTVIYQGETVVLKLLTEYGWEERAGAVALRHFDGHGAVRLYQSDEQAQLLEYVPGGDLLPMVESGSDGDAQASRIIADILNQIHSNPSINASAGLFPLERWFEALFAQAAKDEQSIYRHGAQVARRLLDDPRDVRVLHGDIHHMNIRQSARGWLAFDPKGLLGERTYDCANSLCNPFRGRDRFDPLVHDEARLLRNAAILANETGIDRARVLAFTFAYSCLSAAWTVSDGETEWALNIARIVEPHVTL